MESFKAELTRAQEPGTRTPVQIDLKDAARAAAVARALVAVARAAPGVDAIRRLKLGLRPRAAGRPARIAAPATPPRVSVEAVPGEPAVRVELRGVMPEGASRRAEPRGAGTDALFVFVGEDPPAGPDRWTFAGATGRTTARLTIPHDTPPGYRVWVTARWQTPTGRPGPLAAPVQTCVAGGWVAAAPRRAAA